MRIFYRFIFFTTFLATFLGLTFGSNKAGVEVHKNDPKKIIVASRVVESIKIDGVLDDEIWLVAKPSENFIQLEPLPGKPSANQTIVQVAYDDAALYIAATLMVDSSNNISKQFFERDNLGDQIESDWFGVFLDTYMDGINGNGFIVGPSNGQMDIKFSSDDDDTSWDAVWQSAVKIHNNSWVVEIRIPYSALRFPEKEIQNWHVQFIRKTFKLNEEAFWSEIDPQQEGFFNQAGILTGMKNIKSPVRLAVTPFIALNVDAFNNKNSTSTTNWTRSITGGMDIKYGINDAFTLDMTLVPDFGQVRSDNQVLNLSPFEVRFDENRQFFTEGTELFGKANLFYSRRIGGSPLEKGRVQDQLFPGETITENPSRVQLLNATKISGRTNKGTGLGFFNAIADQSFATITNLKGENRKVRTNPLTNYNIMVIDQNLPNNSYVSLINTNVLREGKAYDANVTGTEFKIQDKQNNFFIAGEAAVSQLLHPSENINGYKYNLEIGKQSGNINWEISTNVESDKWDPNDLGLVFQNNERNLRGWIGYTEYEAFGPFLRMNGGIFSRLSGLHKFTGEKENMFRNNLFTEVGFEAWWKATFKNFFRYNASVYFQPIDSYDYFEPRTPGRFYTMPSFGNYRLNFETDNRKKISTEMTFRYVSVKGKGRNRINLEIEPTFRISDRFAIGYSIELNDSNREEGFVRKSETGAIVFGRRERITTNNLISANYSFSSNSTINFRLRHNWTQVRYESFHGLNTDGSLSSSDYTENEDINFNAFTIDAVYRWRFAPGSDIFITYKNAVFGRDNMSMIGFGENIGNLFNNPVSNSLAIKVLYYLDYLDVKQAFKKKA